VKKPFIAFALAAMLVLSTFATAIADTATIGNDDNERTQRDTSWMDWHLVDANNPAEVYGHIDEIRYHSLADNPMRFFTVNDELVVQWVSDEFDAGTGQQSHVIAGDPVRVSPGDMLGMYFAQTGTISFAGGGGRSTRKDRTRVSLTWETNFTPTAWSAVPTRSSRTSRP
jgi:hypothetical protein